MSNRNRYSRVSHIAYAPWLDNSKGPGGITNVLSNVLADGKLTQSEAETVARIYNAQNNEIQGELRKLFNKYGYAVSVTPSQFIFIKRSKKRRLFSYIPKIDNRARFIIILAPVIFVCSLRLLGVI